MINTHSSVDYIEPNLSSTGLYKVVNESGGTSWKVNDEYERTPRLEDYSIYFNLEVEVCSRNNISANRTITTDVLVLSYRSNLNSSASTVNFMGGTKIKCNNKSDSTVQNLTTNYADMYVGDLYDYGTTEMIGVKSVDVEYLSACVPLITVKFTDVRGISLFQPTELSRTNTYQGINGINADNVAQSFFQCFFRVPMPRFTMTIKGFYGKPVTYECMCDKFDTKFNSNTGDFDITTRFIGYSYSFLTDISIDALLAAPYSDYGGKNGNYNEYWDKMVKNGEFTIWNKEKTNKDPMPTLFEIWGEMQSILNNANIMETSVEIEENTHEQEIDELKALRELYEKWYTELFNNCVDVLGKDYCYLFKKQGDKGEYYRVLILVTEINNEKFSFYYNKFPDSFKELNKELHAAVENYNANHTNFKKLADVSLDYDDIPNQYLFNKTRLDPQGRVLFQGFHKENKIPETQVVNNVFYGVDYRPNENSKEQISEEEIQNKQNMHKRHILETIYGFGRTQYIKCFSIELDYSSIQNRINYLQADANKSQEEKEKEARLKALNKKVLEKMGWYPSIENFTRIMMAHFETLMHLMYSMVSKCEGRTAGELGVTTGPDGNCVDVNAASNVIPPFPRVTKNILGDDGITKVEDTWVGIYHGEKAFEEVDFIDGFFNAIEKMRALKKDFDAKIAEQNREVVTELSTYGGVIKHPLSTFDFYLTRNPYGNSDTLSNDLNGYDFAGKVCLRMFNILSLGSILDKPFSNDETLKAIARTEADNFHELVKITNEKFLDMFRGDDGVISSEKIIDIVTKENKEHPWGEKNLFTNNGSLWLSRYKTDGNVYIYPIQDIDFGSVSNGVKKNSWMDEALSNLNQGKITSAHNNISLSTLPINVNANEINLNSNSAYGNALILNKEEIDKYEEALNNANDNCNSEYTKIYDEIVKKTAFNENEYYEWIDNNIPSICTCLSNGQKIEEFETVKNLVIKVNGEQYSSHNIGNSLGNDVRNNTTNNFTITEVFGVNEKGDVKADSSYFKCIAVKKNNKYDGQISYDGIGWVDKKQILAILGINTSIKNKTIKQFDYMPKINMLQFGAIAFISTRPNREINEEILKGLFISKLGISGKSTKDLYSNKIKQVSLLSSQVRQYFAKYFCNWCNANGKRLTNILENEKNYIKPKKSQETNKCLLDENSKDVKWLTNELLMPTMYIRLSVNAIGGRDSKDYKITSGQAVTYLDAFIDRLKEIYLIDHEVDKEGNVIKTVDEPKHTSDDMKAELYRYMKQVYDKWIPMSSFDDWKLETFFNRNQGEEKGHTFYFIDSYYNDIGHKLLINPKNLMERIDALLDNADVNAMMLGFMADIYGWNKCMMRCIQNFADLSRKGSMTEMFMPMPFNSVDWKNEVNKYPSFVVVYPYEPSKNLNIPNNEYNDDGFMLNDENETPKAIRSKDIHKDGCYVIPAFGVSYGKQYQSYFKSVNINMQSPIATQQSIKAKHYILQQAADTRSVGVVGQDLYDVYSTQSFTCDVEMMGCAWVQPLMYFVLLNVPMFRGTYLIMKVRHSLKPGDMTTTFTGCRMANISNKLIEDLFTDDEMLGNNEYNNGDISNREEKADIDNDCPYKVYPLWGSNGVGENLSSELERKVQRSDCYSNKEYNLLKNDTILMALSRIAANEGGQYSQKLELQEMLVATTMYNRRIHDGNYKNAVFRHIQYDIIKAASTTPTNWVIDIVRNVFTQSPSWILTKYSTTTVTNNNLKAWANSSNFKKGAKITSSKITLDDLRKIKYFGNYHEYATGSNKWVLERPAIMAEDATIDGKYGHCFNCDENEPFMWEVQKNLSEKTEKEDVNQAFFNAVNKSAQATPSINVELKLGKVGDYYTISQKDNGTEKLPLVFDMILNSEYFNNIQKLYWVYPTGGTSCYPLHIDYIAIEKPKKEDKKDPNDKKVKIAQTKAIGETERNAITSDANEKLLKSLAKYRAKVGNDKYIINDVPQLKDLSILDKYKPKDCGSLFSSGGEGESNSLVNINVTDVSCNVQGGKIGDWNVAASANYLISNSKGGSSKKCWAYVKRALVAGGFPFDGSVSAYQAKFFLEKKGFKCIKKGTYVGHKGTEYNGVCIGDITVFEPYYAKDGYHKHGHIDMWCGQQWISDFKQSGNWVNSSAKGEFSVWRYSGSGMK